MQTTSDINRPILTDDVYENATDTRPVDETSHTEVRRHYPASAFRGPLFETRDRIALIMATVMLIGPLIALPLGF